MLSETIKPGDTVWLLEQYQNTIRQKTVNRVESGGPIMEGDHYPESWGNLFESEQAAIDAAIKRAEAAVRTAEKGVVSAKAALVRLRRKYATDAAK
jgi:hypothetical protein